MKTVNLLLLLLISCYSSSQNTYPKEIEEKIKAVENGLCGRVKIAGQPDYTLAERMKHYKAVGLSIAVVNNYKVEWAKGYGWADVKEKRPVTVNTLFEPGSISKSLNAVGVLKLVQDNRLDLNEDINTYLKSWKFPYDSVSHGKKITLAQLLSHSAGLTVHGFPGYDRKDTIPTLPQVLNGKRPANTEAVRSQFEPGVRFQYSGGGTTISQLIIQDVTKQPYDKFMYDNVLKPIGMVNSFYTQPPAAAKLPLCATGYKDESTPVEHKFHVYPEQGAAGLWMTPSDLCNYIIETQLALEGKSTKVLNQELTKLRLTPYNDKSSALGVFIENRDSVLYFQHSAGNEGFCGIYFGSMEGGDGVAVFLNTQSYSILPEIVNSVANVYNWRNFYKPVSKKVVAVPEGLLKTYTGIYHFDDQLVHIHKKEDGYYMYNLGADSKMYFTSDTHFFNMEFGTEKDFVTNDLGRVTGYIRTMNGKVLSPAAKVTHADTIHASQEHFNSMGWHLLELKEPALAIEFLQRGVDLYPGDLVLTGNLAHAHLFNNDYEKALNIYKAHRTERLSAATSWDDMINEDFLYFKKAGIDKAPMDRIYNDLQLKKPVGF